MDLNVDKIYLNDNNKVVIVLPEVQGEERRSDIEGWLTSDFQFHVDAKWEAQGTSGLEKGLNEIAQTFVSQRIISLRTTMLAYSGTELISFSLPLVFVDTRGDRSTSVVEKVKSLYEGTLPYTFYSKDTVMDLTNASSGVLDGLGKQALRVNNKFVGLDIIESPFKYSKTEVMNPKGCFTVKIGKYFEGRPLVMTGCRFQYSKQTLKSGNPLYAEGEISFSFPRVMSRTEILNCFKTLA